MKSKSPYTRFWRKVSKGRDCWIWDGAKIKGGYGLVSIKGKTIIAHRLSWIIHYGEIPDGIFVCHRCDVPACVNPEHLFLGTHKENMADMVSKSRHLRNRGPRNHFAKLSENQVKEIRSSGQDIHELCVTYKVSEQTIKDIRNRKSWNHIL